MNKKCLICKEEILLSIIDDVKICCKCMMNLSTTYDKFIDTLNEQIEDSYNISMPGNLQIPVTECSCKHNSVLPFDYFTMPLDNGNICVVLCCICRGCNGYRTVTLYDINIPIDFKPEPKHTGLSVLEIEKIQEVSYIQ